MNNRNRSVRSKRKRNKEDCSSGKRKTRFELHLPSRALNHETFKGIKEWEKHTRQFKKARFVLYVVFLLKNEQKITTHERFVNITMQVETSMTYINSFIYELFIKSV